MKPFYCGKNDYIGFLTNIFAKKSAKSFRQLRSKNHIISKIVYFFTKNYIFFRQSPYLPLKINISDKKHIIFLEISLFFDPSIMKRLEDIIRGPIFCQLSVFGLQFAVALYQIETVWLIQNDNRCSHSHIHKTHNNQLINISHWTSFRFRI